MRKQQVIVGAVVAGVGAAIVATVRVIRALPLVEELVANDAGDDKKDEKKDMKKKGNGPRTQRKKAKKGK